MPSKITLLLCLLAICHASRAEQQSGGWIPAQRAPRQPQTLPAAGPHDKEIPTLPVAIEVTLPDDTTLPSDEGSSKAKHPQGDTLPRHWDVKCRDAAGGDYYLFRSAAGGISNHKRLVVVKPPAPPVTVEVPEPTEFQPPANDELPRVPRATYRGSAEWNSHYGPWKNGKTTLFVDSIVYENQMVQAATCTTQDPDQVVEFRAPVYEDYIHSLSEAILDRMGDDVEKIVHNVSRFLNSPFSATRESDYLFELTGMLQGLPKYSLVALQHEVAKLKSTDPVAKDLKLAITSVPPLSDAERGKAMAFLGLSRAATIQPPEVLDDTAISAVARGMGRFNATATAKEKAELSQNLVTALAQISPTQVRDLSFWLSQETKPILTAALENPSYQALREAQTLLVEIKAKPKDTKILQRSKGLRPREIPWHWLSCVRQPRPI